MKGFMRKNIIRLLKLKKYPNLANEPIQVDIAITERCCLKCKFCDCWKRKVDVEKELSIE